MQIVKIDLLGSSFNVQTDESLDYMEGLLARLRSRIDALKSSTRVADPLKLSLILNITLLDELMRARSSPEERDAGEEISRVAARLIADIDRSLEEPG